MEQLTKVQGEIQEFCETIREYQKEIINEYGSRKKLGYDIETAETDIQIYDVGYMEALEMVIKKLKDQELWQ